MNTIDAAQPRSILTVKKQQIMNTVKQAIWKKKATEMMLPVKKRISLRIKEYALDRRSYSTLKAFPLIMAFS